MWSVRYPTRVGVTLEIDTGHQSGELSEVSLSAYGFYFSMWCVCFSLILDNERWKQADVPAEFQALVDHIAATGEQTLCSTGMLRWFIYWKVWRHSGNFPKCKVSESCMHSDNAVLDSRSYWKVLAFNHFLLFSEQSHMMICMNVQICVDCLNFTLFFSGTLSVPERKTDRGKSLSVCLSL